MINLILCGGSGTRLWPVSRSLMPKQFAPLFDGQSLFRKTVVTNSALCESQFIVSNADQFFLAKDQLEVEGMTGSKFLLEPVGRNTAPAIALACLTMDPETIVLVSPSDHVIRKKDEYKKVLLRAQELAEAGNLVTFGITPTSPETGYGYIEADGENVRLMLRGTPLYAGDLDFTVQTDEEILCNLTVTPALPASSSVAFPEISSSQ